MRENSEAVITPKSDSIDIGRVGRVGRVADALLV